MYDTFRHWYIRLFFLDENKLFRYWYEIITNKSEKYVVLNCVYHLLTFQKKRRKRKKRIISNELSFVIAWNWSDCLLFLNTQETRNTGGFQGSWKIKVERRYFSVVFFFLGSKDQAHDLECLYLYFKFYVLWVYNHLFMFSFMEVSLANKRCVFKIYN